MRGNQNRGLFDWTFTDALPAEAPGNYLVATIGGEDVAAIGTADGGPEGVWRTYIAVDDADASAAAVEGAGGEVTLAPVDAGPGGRRAVCVDPRGAAFSLWQACARPGAQRVNVHGTWNLQRSAHHRPARRGAVLRGGLRLGDRRRRLRHSDTTARLRRPPRGDRQPRHQERSKPT